MAAGPDTKAPIPDFTTFRSYWIRNGASGAGGWQARRDIVAELLDPTRGQLVEVERRRTPQIKEDPHIFLFPSGAVVRQKNRIARKIAPAALAVGCLAG